ncbi:surface-adhesin E family protein [Sphingomonas sp. LY54]|uniref:surface-adhesin E family protein n=1 Tax=Sphingomonas sp. LY54 TaxID=3095343 RepID=UPI002D777B3D|nr:surface-adhesin E family protein [Sphingomonas sp. LY54]WRP28957.1 surface-adhesin E family protein [Sphingomonas sp. LY54]
MRRSDKIIAGSAALGLEEPVLASLALMFAAATAPPAFVLVAFAGDEQVGFVAPGTIRVEGDSKRFETLWIYTPAQHVGPHLVRRAVRTSRADCARGTVGEEQARFYGEGGHLLFAEPTRAPDMRPVLPRSASEDVLRFVCAGEEPYPDIKVSPDVAAAATLADEIAAFYRANPTR